MGKQNVKILLIILLTILLTIILGGKSYGKKKRLKITGNTVFT